MGRVSDRPERFLRYFQWKPSSSAVEKCSPTSRLSSARNAGSGVLSRGFVAADPVRFSEHRVPGAGDQYPSSFDRENSTGELDEVSCQVYHSHIVSQVGPPDGGGSGWIAATMLDA
jgi:hypothetical protein